MFNFKLSLSMKKILVFTMMCLFTVCVNAQEWDSTDYEADELKGQESYTAYNFTNETGMFVYFSNYDDYFKICTLDGIFDYKGRYHELKVIIGFYDENDKLVEKFNDWIYVQEDNSKIAGAKGKKSKKVITYIKQNNGYVRIIAERYGRTNFDLKVPCLNN